MQSSAYTARVTFIGSTYLAHIFVIPNTQTVPKVFLVTSMSEAKVSRFQGPHSWHPHIPYFGMLHMNLFASGMPMTSIKGIQVSRHHGSHIWSAYASIYISL